MIFQDRTGLIYQVDEWECVGWPVYDRFQIGEVIESSYGRTRFQRLRYLLPFRPKVMIVVDIKPEVINGKRCNRIIFGDREMTLPEWLRAIWRAID